MKRVLVTGATGFIGRHCVPILVARGDEVHAVSSARPGNGAGAEWHRTDLLVPGAAEALIARVRPTHLLHLAWSPYIPERLWTTPDNLRWVEASLALLRAFRGHGGQCVVVAGTCAEYEWTHGYCVEDHTPLEPTTLYGACKHTLHTRLRAFCSETGLRAIWARIFHVFGPHEYPARLVAHMISSLLRGRPGECSSGDQIRDLLHVEDVASAFATLIDAGIEGPVNIGSGAPTSLHDVVTMIGQKIGRSDLIRLGARAAPVGDPALLLPSVQRLHGALGWRPRYTLDRGLDDVIEWWRRTLNERSAGAGPNGGDAA